MASHRGLLSAKACTGGPLGRMQDLLGGPADPRQPERPPRPLEWLAVGSTDLPVIPHGPQQTRAQLTLQGQRECHLIR